MKIEEPRDVIVCDEEDTVFEETIPHDKEEASTPDQVPEDKPEDPRVEENDAIDDKVNNPSFSMKVN